MKLAASVLVTLVALIATLQVSAPSGLAQTGACQTNPDPVDSADPSVIVSSPASGASVSSPLAVSGQARVFEATVSLALYGASGNEISTATTQADEGQVLSPFTGSISFSVTASTPACLWVFEVSARDGSPTNVVQVPLTLVPAGSPAPTLPSTGSGPQAPGGSSESLTWLAGLLAVAVAACAAGGFLAMRRTR